MTATRAQRINARHDKIWETAMNLKRDAAMTATKPATPLPWESGMVETEPHCVAFYLITQATNIGGWNVAQTLSNKERDAKDAAYIAHAANAYPRLVEALRDALSALVCEGHHEGVSRPVTDGRALLRELGEQP